MRICRLSSLLISFIFQSLVECRLWENLGGCWLSPLEGEALASADAKGSDGTDWDMASYSRESPSTYKKAPVFILCCPLWTPGPFRAASRADATHLSCFWEPVRSLITALFTLLFLSYGLQKLITAVYADYARSLKNLGFKQGAVLFASKAGAAGKDLLNELESSKEERIEEWQLNKFQGIWPGRQIDGRGLVWLWSPPQSRMKRSTGSCELFDHCSKAMCAQKHMSVYVESKFVSCVDLRNNVNA